MRIEATAAEATPMATAETASAEQGAAAASASQPGVVELHELQPRSAPFGTWEVAVYHPEIYDYSYQWNGKMVQQRVFRCMLVSTTKPQVYCVGEVRAGKGRPRAREEALQKFTVGLIFRISKVALDKEGKKQYMHAPHKVVVDLGSTRAVPVLARPGTLVPDGGGVRGLHHGSTIRHHGACQRHVRDKAGRDGAGAAPRRVGRDARGWHW